MISIESVDLHLRRLTMPVESVVLPLGDSPRRCLRATLVAQRPAPPFDRVMMDGYALRAATRRPGQLRFRISGSALAGMEPPTLPDETCAIEVMTGAMLPPGADCVVPVECCSVQGETLEVEANASLNIGQFIHRCGSEYAEGKQILSPGITLQPAHLALAASEGYTELCVNTDLQVVLFTTGDEIVEAGSRPLPWQIFGTHGTAILAALSSAPDVLFRHQHVRDDLDNLIAAIDACDAKTDVIILCGAMSKGRKDYGIEAVQQCGFKVAFHRVAQRPGHPMALAQRGQTLLFGLPGNPLAVLFTFFRHVLPTLDRLRGCPPKEPFRVPVFGKLPALADTARFVPCRLEHGQAYLAMPHNSGDLLCLAESEGFVEIPPAECNGNHSDLVSFWTWK